MTLLLTGYVLMQPETPNDASVDITLAIHTFRHTFRRTLRQNPYPWATVLVHGSTLQICSVLHIWLIALIMVNKQQLYEASRARPCV